MPSNQKQVDTHVFTEGINTSLASEYLPPNTARYILNCYTVSSGVGNVGIVTNVKGNVSINTPLPTGENKVIGTAVDEEDKFFYFFVYNSLGFHTIFQFNALTRTVIRVIQSITDTNNVDVLQFDKDRLILMTDIRGDKLYWVDGWNDARKINIKKALDKSDTGYGTVILEEYINAYKLAPYTAPKAAYFSDTTKKFNRMYGASRKFASLYVYDDLERSVYSDFSNVVNPVKESFTGVNTIPTDNNAIDITVETGSKIVTKIEIAMFQPSVDTPNPAWVTIAVLDKKKLGIPDNSTYIYRFYNDGGAYTPISATQIAKPYSYLPKAPLCQCIAMNAMVYSNFNEGFPDVPINTELSLTYEDLFIEDGTENEQNNPQLIATEIPDSGDYLSGTFTGETYVELDGTVVNSRAKRLSNAHTVTIGNDVKKGNIFTYNIRNGDNNFNVVVTATVTDTATTIANKMIAQLVTTGLIIRKSNGNVSPPEHYIYNLETDGLGNVTFKFVIIDYYKNGYFDSSGSVNPVYFDTLKDTGQSVSNIKLGAGIKFGIVYGDFQGRRSLVYTNDTLSATTATQNELGGLKSPIFSLTIKHQPPVWAKWYQIVRTDDLTYGNFIQMLIQNVVEVQATNTGGDYLDLVVGSLYTYQKIHPNTTLKYQFKKGDRVRFISDEDGDYYDPLESEILDYKETADDLIESNLQADGSSNVTVASASSDNIGKYIQVDGNERLITGVASSTQYILNAPIGKSGQDPYLSYRLIDRRGVIRIRKPSGVALTNNSLVEIFTPSSSNAEGSLQQFYHFNKQFDILNAGTDTRYHAGNQQNQSATEDAIVRITEGTVYVRNRELPITNTIPNAQVIIKVVEDPSYSDFYFSDLNDNGRINVEDNGLGVVHFGDRMRFSNVELENTAINGLNDFANLDRVDYNDKYGDFKLTVYTENQILAFKDQKDCIVPVYQTVIQDQSGQELLGASRKLLNDIRYYSFDGGIGDHPESYCRNEGNHYHISADMGVWIRLGGDGATPISKVYGIDNEARELIQKANLSGTHIYGAYDELLDAAVWAIEGYNTRTYFQGFNEGDWQLLSDAPPEGTEFTIVTPPTKGTLTFPNGLPLYTNDGTLGSDSYTYSYDLDGDTIVKKVCLTIIDNTPTTTAWRAQQEPYTCVLDEYGLRTGYKAFNFLEQYYTATGENTGVTKPNSPSDPDYIAPVVDETACVPQPVDPTPDPFTFVDVVNAELSTMYVSNAVTISGINIPVDISITTGQYRKNGGAWTNVAGTVVNGDIVEVRRESSSVYETTLGTTLTVSTYSDTFSITTKEEVLENIELQLVIFDSYENAYYNAEDSRGYALRFIMTGGLEYDFVISDDIVRDNNIYTFSIPLSNFPNPVVFVTCALTVASPNPSSVDVFTDLFRNYVLLNTQTINSHTIPPSTDGFEYQSPIPTVDGTTGINLVANDVIKIAARGAIDPDAVGILVIDLYDNDTLDVCAYCDTAGIEPYQQPVYRGTNNFFPNDGTPAANCWALASDLVTGGGSLVYRFEFNLARLITSYPAIDDFNFKVRGRASGAGSLSGAYSKKGADSGNMKMNGTAGSYVPTTENSTDLGIIPYSGKAYVGGANGSIGLAVGSVILEFNYNVSTNTLTLL